MNQRAVTTGPRFNTKKGPEVQQLTLREDAVNHIKELLESLKWGTAWVSGATFRTGHVTKANLTSTSVAFVDLDYHENGSKASPTDEVRAALLRSVRTSGANLAHHTPHGARLVYVLSQATSAQLALRVVRGAAELAAKSCTLPAGYELDPVSSRPAQVYYGPRGHDVEVLRTEPWRFEDLARHAVEEEKSPEAIAKAGETLFDRARDAFVIDHPIAYTDGRRECPICKHRDCFNAHPDDSSRWWCWSTDHDEGVGHHVESAGAYMGDAIDIEAHARGLTPREILVADGYLEPVLDFTELGVAAEMVARHGEEIRRCEDWGQWLVWEGGRWLTDRKLEVYEKTKVLCRDVADRALGRKNGAKHARGLSTAKTVGAVERLVRSTGSLATTSDDWDADPWALATPEGIIDLRSGQIRETSRDDLITRLAGTTLDLQAEAPTWFAFLDKVTGGDEDLQGFLARLVGYSMTGSTREHAFFFLYGTGSNGKSVFLNTISAVLGNYATTTSMEVLTASKHDRHPTELADLRGARLVTAQETEEGRAWAESRIKLLTGGDTVKARFMRADFFEFTPQFKLIVAGNHKPRLVNVDEAMRRRLHMVPFTVTIPKKEQDPELTEKLRDEFPAILAWALAGCLWWQEEGLNPPKVVRSATLEYFMGQDLLQEWLNDRVTEGVGFTETKSAVFENWVEFCARQGEDPGNMKKMTQRLEVRGFRSKRNEKARYWEGMKLTNISDMK